MEEYQHEARGRCVRASRAFSTGEEVLAETPVVQARNAAKGAYRLCGGNIYSCPAGCAGDCPAGCAWTAAAALPELERACAFCADLAKSTTDCAPGPEADAWTNTVCLLALLIQAASSEAVWTWIASEMCEGSRDAEDSIRLSTMFSRVVPPPPFISFDSSSDGKTWADHIRSLLLRVQTNLFVIDASCLGLFERAHKIEHSCCPNTRVTVGADGALVVHAIGPIEAGDAISFCYLPGSARAGGALEAQLVASPLALAERRRLLHAELCFVCRCD
eukprot:5627884-Prymnesium_polylepis.1